MEYYKKLCGISDKSKHRSKKDKKNNNYYPFYATWRKHILDQIKDIDTDMIEECSRFLNQQYRNNDITFGLTQTILIPYIICLVSDVLSFAFNIFANPDTFKSNVNVILFPVCLFVIFWFIIRTFKQMFSTRKESVYKYFYQDMKEIVDERIEQLNK